MRQLPVATALPSSACHVAGRGVRANLTSFPVVTYASVVRDCPEEGLAGLLPRQEMDRSFYA